MTMLAPPMPPLSPSALSPRSTLRLLKILERTSGECVFSAQWKWCAQAHAEGVDSLVQSFTQFAREIDGGNVVRVHFNAVNNRSSSRSLKSDDDLADGCSSSVEMQSVQSEVLHAVLFHDKHDDALAQRLREFLDKVERAYRATLSADDTAPPSSDAASVSDGARQARADRFRAILDQELLPELE